VAVTTRLGAGGVAMAELAADPEAVRAREAVAKITQAGGRLHQLPALPETCYWGFFDNSLPPVLRVDSDDVVYIEALTPNAGDAPDLLMDAGIEAVYASIPLAQRGPGPHLQTGPVWVEGAEPGDTLEARILGVTPRLPWGTNIAGWWGYLYEDFKKERITIYQLDVARREARAAFAFDYTTTPKYDSWGIITPPNPAARVPALPKVAVPLRPHLGVCGVAPKENGKINTVPPGDFGGNVDNWRIGGGATMYYPVFHRGALFYVGDPHLAEGDGELSGTAIEASANVWIQLRVRKDLRVDAPLLETDTHWIVHGYDEDLNRAMKIAARRLLDFVTRTMGLTRDDAYSLISVAADFTVTQVVNVRQGVHGAIPKGVFR
jgi:acetamidase/formamidase